MCVFNYTIYICTVKIEILQFTLYKSQLFNELPVNTICTFQCHILPKFKNIGFFQKACGLTSGRSRSRSRVVAADRGTVMTSF